jgi:diguanylate cyclase (GGDEF)-like protein
MDRRSAAPAWLVFGVGLLAIAAIVAGPRALAVPLVPLVELGSIVATVVGIRRNTRPPAGGARRSRRSSGRIQEADPGRRRVWWAFVAAEVGFLLAGILRVAIPGADSTPPGPAALIPDLLAVPAYLAFAYPLLRMLRLRRARDDDPARADAVLIGLGAALAAWTLLIEPDLNAAELPSLPQLAAAFFPMVDVALLAIVAQLLLADGVRKPSLWLLATANAALFAGDLMLAIRYDDPGAGPAALLTALDGLYLLGYLALGTAALHPTMRTLTEPQPVLVRRLGGARTVGIAAMLIAPSALAIAFPPPTFWSGVVRLALSAGLTATLTGRIVRANNSRARAEATTRHRATHDALTDLPNRELLTETVARWCDLANADEREISLLFLDLDRFKLVNDNWGHPVGDELLCAVSSRLSEVVRDEDLVCRIGGDEFVIAMAGTAGTEVSAAGLAESMAQRLLATFTRPFELSVGSIIVTPSIGIARSSGAAEALELIRDADIAMYQAKSEGRNGYAFFDASLRDRTRARVDLDQAMRGAFERGELSVAYQPIIALDGGSLCGFEALMRWRHPVYGSVSPVDFIPIAEDTGLIVPIGTWLLGEAVEQLATWRDQQPLGEPLHVSVNISFRQLRDPALVDTVRAALQRTGLPPSALWLEITESGLVDDSHTATDTLLALHDLGVVLCIDDFGTGYASLNYVRLFPAGIVKIDRSFVSGIGGSGSDEAIIRAVMAMAHALGQRVVAEGVETAEQRDWLVALGCDMVQGWLYGAPRPGPAQDALVAGDPRAWVESARSTAH